MIVTAVTYCILKYDIWLNVLVAATRYCVPKYDIWLHIIVAAARARWYRIPKHDFRLYIVGITRPGFYHILELNVETPIAIVASAAAIRIRCYCISGHIVQRSIHRFCTRRTPHAFFFEISDTFLHIGPFFSTAGNGTFESDRITYLQYIYNILSVYIDIAKTCLNQENHPLLISFDDFSNVGFSVVNKYHNSIDVDEVFQREPRPYGTIKAHLA